MHKFLAAALTALSVMGVQAQALEPRDFNGDGTIDAWYERSADLTWLADVNSAAAAGLGSPYGPGTLDYNSATTWLSSLDVYGVGGWRLPEATFTATVDTNMSCAMFITSFPGAGCTYTPDPNQNELAHLISVTLGNDGAFTDAGPFAGYTENMASPTQSFWLSMLGHVSAWDIDIAHYYFGSSGQAHANPEMGVAFIWGVRTGDVQAAPVPEPETYALMLAGLVAMGVKLRRRHKSA